MKSEIKTYTTTYISTDDQVKKEKTIVIEVDRTTNKASFPVTSKGSREFGYLKVKIELPSGKLQTYISNTLKEYDIPTNLVPIGEDTEVKKLIGKMLLANLPALDEWHKSFTDYLIKNYGYKFIKEIKTEKGMTALIIEDGDLLTAYFAIQILKEPKKYSFTTEGQKFVDKVASEFNLVMKNLTQKIKPYYMEFVKTL